MPPANRPINSLAVFPYCLLDPRVSLHLKRTRHDLARARPWMDASSAFHDHIA
jgi:hypothetical protein